MGGNSKKIVTFGTNVLSAMFCLFCMSPIWDVRYWEVSLYLYIIYGPKCSVMGFKNKIVTNFVTEHPNQWTVSRIWWNLCLCYYLHFFKVWKFSYTEISFGFFICFVTNILYTLFIYMPLIWIYSAYVDQKLVFSNSKFCYSPDYSWALDFLKKNRLLMQIKTRLEK